MKKIFTLILHICLFSCFCLTCNAVVPCVKDGLYTLKNVSSGYMLNVYAGKDANGTKVTTWEFDGTTDQRIYIAQQKEGKYLLKFNASSQGRVIDVNRGASLTASIDDGDKIDLWTANDLDAQYFYIYPCGNGAYTFELVAKPNHVISATSTATAKSNGVQLELKKYTGADYQKWYICDTSGKKINACLHANTERNNIGTSYAVDSDKEHTVTVKYNLVCKDCGEVTKSNLTDTKKEAHRINETTCGQCNYKAYVPTVCSHSNTYNERTETLITPINDTQHSVTETFAVYCSDCKEICGENKNNYNEKHNLINGACSKCSYVDTSAHQCEHKNTAKHAVEDSLNIAIADDEKHSISSYYHLYCIDCQTYVEEYLLDFSYEKHTFVDNICTACRLEVFPEPPGATNLTVSKTVFAPGEAILLSWTSATDATGYDIHIYKVGQETRYRLDSGFTGTSCSIQINDEGSYTLAIYSTNAHTFTRGNVVSVEIKKAFVEKTGYVYNTDGSNLNMRSNPKLNSTIVTKLAAGSAVTITGEAVNGFYPVKFEKYTGYASTQYITMTKPETTGFIWPVIGSGRVTCKFRGYKNHNGLDIGGNPAGTSMKIVASKAGTVTYVATGCKHDYGKNYNCGCAGGFGKYVKIKHNDGTETIYAHLRSVNVSVGTKVSQGQQIGMMGSTGWSSGVHLHFEIRINGVSQNPQNYVKY